MSVSPLVVEFVGLPTVGKTSVSADVADALAQQGIDTAEPTRTIAALNRGTRIRQKTRVAGRAMLRTPRDTAHCGLVTVRSRQDSVHDLISTLFNQQYILGVYAMLPTYSADVALLDQGWYQSLWSVCFRGNQSPESTVRRFKQDYSPEPDVVVTLTANRESILERITDRSINQSRMRSDVSDIKQAEHCLATITKQLRFRAKRSDRLVHLTLENTTPSDRQQCIDEVVNVITDRI